ncbi:DUF63 family protein [Candidatus Pyrohabitans sp.]
MGLSSFFYEYFVKPLETGSGYNPYNTLAYGLLLLLGAYVVLRLLRWKGIRLDEDLFRALIPFVLLGGLIRALEEFARVSGSGVLPHSFLFLTPGVYFLVVFLAMLSIAAGLVLRGERYHRVVSYSGAFLCAIASVLFVYDVFLVASERAVSQFSGETLKLQVRVFVGILLFSIGLALLAMLPLRRLNMVSRLNALIVWGVSFDAASVSLASLSLGYGAEQPLTQGMLSMHPLTYPLFKMGLYLLLLYFVERDVPREEETHWLTKLILLVLSLPMGLHNSLQVLLGV